MRIFIFFALLLNSCAVKNEVVENQISLETNQTVSTNQNTNVQNVSAEITKKDIDYFAHFKPQHREVLREWLKSKKYLRPGIEEIDNRMFQADSYRNKVKFKEEFADNMKFLRDTVGKNGYQYYSVGDLNYDGKEDFAVLLVDSRKRSRDDPDFFALAIFNAPFKKGERPSYYEENLYGITNSYLVFDKMIKKHLYLGKFESDVYCATYYPRGKTYYFKDCM
ncbi:MAG: hypothetical protein ABJA66_11250 [Actinomycetota bacterium]